MTRWEAVDGDRRVLVEAPDDVSAQVAAGHAAVFRDMVEQMFRSGRAERARQGRVVGEAGTREDPTVTIGATSPTTEHEVVVGGAGMLEVPAGGVVNRFVPFATETTTGAVPPDSLVRVEEAVGRFISSVLVEDLVGPPVEQAPAALTLVEPESEPKPRYAKKRVLKTQRAQAAAEKVARFVELARGTDEGTPTGQMVKAVCRQMEITEGAGWTYLRKAREAGLLPKGTGTPPPSTARLRPVSAEPVRVAAAPPSITPPRPTAKKAVTPPLAAGEKLTEEERLSRFADTYRASTLTGDRRIDQAARAAGLALVSGDTYLRRCRKLGLLPDPLGSLAAAAGPITGGVA